MGMFNFLKDVGANLFGKGKNEAKEIEKLLTAELGNNITDLKAEYKDEVVTLFGKCDSHATKEKAVLLAGNVKGVARVNDANLTAPAPAEKTEFYTVKRGD